MKKLEIVSVIMSGGSGSRLWPASRIAHPKPFMQLPDGETLLQKTFFRAQACASDSEVVIVTNQALFHETINQVSDVEGYDFVKLSMVLEPFPKNTAGAVLAAAEHVVKNYGEDAVMFISPADHLIPDTDRLHVYVNQAAEIAALGNLVTFGIKPTSPETGFGYIKTFAEEPIASGFRVERFVEKPSLDKAKSFLESGDYFWNSGMFCFQAGHLLEQAKLFKPELVSIVKEACRTGSNDGSYQRVQKFSLDPAEFAKAEDISIDNAIMENSQQVAVIPVDFEWNDIGSWSAMKQLASKDENQNASTSSELLSVNARNNFVRGKPNKKVALVGVNDMIVVDTPDALLVTNSESCQDVKVVFNSLHQIKDQAVELHRTVYRPWGSYTTLEEGENFKIKKIIVKPGQQLSLQSHKHRSEHWVVVSGNAVVINGENEIHLGVNESTFIATGQKHRLSNFTDEPLVVIEVQSGSYLGEDDIQRFDDVYQRGLSL